MGGRADFEERRNRRIERYSELSKKAEIEANARSNSTANRILMSTPGQPILVGHHSEKYHRNLIKRANNDIRKAIELSDKSKYYEQRAKEVANSKAIYNDDPMAIEKLKQKLEKLEEQREKIKARDHEQWELTNIGATIRETKKRIERLEKLEEVQFDEISFKGGKAIKNEEINRIQIIFDSIPNEDVRKELKHRGFHWSRQEGAWQRQFSQNSINATKFIIEDVINKQEEQELE